MDMTGRLERLEVLTCMATLVVEAEPKSSREQARRQFRQAMHLSGCSSLIRAGMVNAFQLDALS